MDEQSEAHEEDVGNPEVSNTSQLLASEKNEGQGSGVDADTTNAKCENCDNKSIGWVWKNFKIKM